MGRKQIIFLLQIISILADDNVNLYMQTVQEGTATSRSYNGAVDASAYKPTSSKIHKIKGVFDYIVIGAGSAGAIIAARLSEDPKIKVLLLEAGGFETKFTEIPSMTPFLQSSEFNWNYKTTPQKTTCLAMTNSECVYPRGKALGGTSVINGMVYTRGNKEDYDNWARAANQEWSYDNVLPYFMKTENNDINGDSGYHGKGGEVNVEYHRPSSPQLDAFIQANIDMGRPILDYNGKDQLGASKTQFTLKNGSRQSTGKTFLFPALNRENLKVLNNSYVTKVLIMDYIFYKRAWGVLFTHDGKTQMVKTKSEIIVSAGVIGSPQILMLSGIGSRSNLEALGIHVIQNLPAVGSNFQEHPAYHSLFFSTNYTEPDRGMETYVREYLEGYGPYTVAANLQGISFFKSKRNMDTLSKNADFELLFQASNNTSNFTQKIHNYGTAAMDVIWKNVNPQKFFTILCLVMHPKSKGTVRLRSASPYDYPLIDTNLLSDEAGYDIAMLREAIQTALELVDTEPFKKINATLAYLPLPQCISEHIYLSDDYWDCQITNLGFHLFHGSGTCRMGRSAITSVVNPELKVHGIYGLRVADSSIFPTPIAGHTNAPAMMVGEMAADLIKKSRS